MMQIERIQTSFIELASAAGRAERNNAPIKLIANLDGTYLYDPDVGWGCLWKIIYAIACCFWPRLRENNLKLAFTKIKKTFDDAVAELQPIIKRYEEHLQQVCRPRYGVKVDISALHKERDQIITWMKATDPFLKLLKNENGKLAQLFKKYFSHSNPFTLTPELRRKCKHYLQFAKIEGILQKPIPMRQLATMAQGIELDPKDAEIPRWMAAVQKNKTEVTIRLFHQVIVNAVTFSKKAEDDVPFWVRVAEVENRLLKALPANEHLKAIFWDKDPVYLKKRNQLKAGDKLVCNDQTYVLGEQLGATVKRDQDQNLVFELQSDPETVPAEQVQQVMVLGINKAVQGIKGLRQNEYRGLVRVAKYLNVDNGGNCALVKKVNLPFAQLEPSKKFDVVLKLLQDMISDNQTPILKVTQVEGGTKELFSTAYLGFDNAESTASQLMATRIARKTDDDLNFSALVALAQETADGDHLMFQRLLNESGMVSHPYVNFFQKIFTEALQNSASQKKISVDQCVKDVAKMEPSASKIRAVAVRNAEQFYTEVRSLHDGVMVLLKEHGAVKATTTELLVNQKINKHYVDSAAICVLWPNPEALKKQIVDDILNNSRSGA